MLNKEELIKHMSDYQDSHIFYPPNIPVKKLNNAMNTYAKEASKDDIMVLVDDTAWGGAKDGLIVTATAVFSKMMMCDPVKFNMEDIQEIDIDKKKIFINGKEFFKFNMPEKFPMMRLINFINDNKNNTSNIEDNNSSSPTESAQPTENVDGLVNCIKAYKKMYSYPKNFFLQDEIPYKSKINFCTNCNIKNPEEIIALIDTTLLKSGKDGVALCTDKIVWRSVAFSDPHAISYKDIEDVPITLKGSTINFGEIGELNAGISDISAFGIKNTIENVASFYLENLEDLPQEEQENRAFYKDFKLKTRNYFQDINDALMAKAKLKSIGNHIDSAIDMFFSVSVEQRNNAFRRDTFKEGDKLKLDALFSQRHLILALDFPKFLRKSNDETGKYFAKIFYQENVTFSLLAFVFGRTLLMLNQELVVNQQAPKSVVLEIMEPLYINILIPYISAKDQSINREQTLSGMSARNAPSDLMTEFKKQSGLYMNAPEPFSWLHHHLTNNLIDLYQGNNRDLVYQKIEYSENGKFKETLKEYQDFVDKCLDKYIYEYIMNLQ